MTYHGSPCWYELASKNHSKVQGFYRDVLSWTWQDAGMPGMTYLLGTVDHAMIAGLYEQTEAIADAWQVYFAVDDIDATALLAKSLGASIAQPPTDIPGTGRFAVIVDPQGASFGVLQPLPMEEGTAGHAFAPDTAGHGVWQDLVCTEAEAAIAFYAALLGWTVSRKLPMGPGTTYHILAHQGQEIGGVFASKTAPYWKPYFGVISVKAAATQVSASGGQVLHGPDPVPGGLFTLQITDPTGVILGLAGAA